MDIRKSQGSSADKGSFKNIIRWHNHLDPNIIKKSWAPHEEDIMFE